MCRYAQKLRPLRFAIPCEAHRRSQVPRVPKRVLRGTPPHESAIRRIDARTMQCLSGSARPLWSRPDRDGSLRLGGASRLEALDVIAWPAQIRASRVRGRRPRGQAEVSEDPGNHLGLIDHGNDAHPPLATATLKDVDGEDSLHQLCPREASRSGNSLRLPGNTAAPDSDGAGPRRVRGGGSAALHGRPPRPPCAAGASTPW